MFFKKSHLRLTPLVLALCLFAVQGFATLHNAAHGFHEHSHHGQTCEVYAYFDHLVLSDDAAPPPVVPAFDAAIAEPVLLAPVSVQSIIPASAFPRGPPRLS